MALQPTALRRGLPVSVISATFCGGAPRTGSEQGPQALLDSGLKEHFRHWSDRLAQFHDCSSPSPDQTSPCPSPGIKRANTVSDFTRKLSKQVENLVAQKLFALTLGGDHSIAIGTLTGVAKAVRETRQGVGLATIWLDAHADINKPESSPSGYVHGMPVAFASGMAKHAAFDWIQDTHLIDLDKFVYIGLRDVDEEERKSIACRQIKVFDMQDVTRHGMERVMDRAMQYIGKNCLIHLSFDIDGLDPHWAPSTGFPVDNGIALADGCYVARRLHETERLVAMDLVEINPLVAPHDLARTLKAARTVIYSALGMEEEA